MALLQHPLLLGVLAASLMSGGAWVGSQMMDDGAACADMDGTGSMMDGHDGHHHRDDGMTDHMDEMHARCHEMMHDHARGNATGDHAHNESGGHAR